MGKRVGGFEIWILLCLSTLGLAAERPQRPLPKDALLPNSPLGISSHQQRFHCSVDKIANLKGGSKITPEYWHMSMGACELNVKPEHWDVAYERAKEWLSTPATYPHRYSEDSQGLEGFPALVRFYRYEPGLSEPVSQAQLPIGTPNAPYKYWAYIGVLTPFLQALPTVILYEIAVRQWEEIHPDGLREFKIWYQSEKMEHDEFGKPQGIIAKPQAPALVKYAISEGGQPVASPIVGTFPISYAQGSWYLNNRGKIVYDTHADMRVDVSLFGGSIEEQIRDGAKKVHLETMSTISEFATDELDKP